jgi:hypothetical protein
MKTGRVSVHVVTYLTLDDITIFFQDFELGKGRIVVECYGEAWSAYFGAMGGQTIRQFVETAGPDYLTNKLSRPKQTKATDKYLRRIVDAIKTEFKPQEVDPVEAKFQDDIRSSLGY